jgi:tripartite-type tricarboxylate transporter receptor subunit TctC
VPEVPTYQEAGIQGLVHDQWLGVLVPAAYMPDAAWAVFRVPPS